MQESDKNRAWIKNTKQLKHMIPIKYLRGTTDTSVVLVKRIQSYYKPHALLSDHGFWYTHQWVVCACTYLFVKNQNQNGTAKIFKGQCEWPISIQCSFIHSTLSSLSFYDDIFIG